LKKPGSTTVINHNILSLIENNEKESSKRVEHNSLEKAISDKTSFQSTFSYQLGNQQSSKKFQPSSSFTLASPSLHPPLYSSFSPLVSSFIETPTFMETPRLYQPQFFFDQNKKQEEKQEQKQEKEEEEKKEEEREKEDEEEDNSILMKVNPSIKISKKYTLDVNQIGNTLKDQLNGLKNYWIENTNFQRKDNAVNEVTHNKRVERIMCFMGWCKNYGKVEEPDLWLYDISSLQDIHQTNSNRYENYICYLTDERKLSSGTIGEHITAAIYSLKYLHQEDSFNDYKNIKSMEKLKIKRNELHRKYGNELKTQNWIKLKENDKYLHFEEIQQVSKQLMLEFLTTDSNSYSDPSFVKNGLKKKEMTTKAKQLQKFLILLFYTSLPPSRGLEIRSLKIDESIQYKSVSNTWWIVTNNYKNVRHIGEDSLELDPKSQSTLIKYLEIFIQDYRSMLVKKWIEKKEKSNPILKNTLQDQKFLFVTSGNSTDQMFSNQSWSGMIQKIFQDKTGSKVSTNSIRSSFITHFYGSEDSSNLSLRESVALSMRHSVNEAMRTYDKRYFFFFVSIFFFLIYFDNNFCNLKIFIYIQTLSFSLFLSHILSFYLFFNTQIYIFRILY
jgi:hypothetical protein